MIGNQKSRNSDERTDQLGRALVRAAAANETEAEAAASSPFLYTRLKARINAELERREARESWLAVLGVVWRVVPAMALVAVFALVMFFSTSWNRQPGGNDYSLFGTSDQGVEMISSVDSPNMTSDDVLETIMNDDEQEASR